MAKVENVNPEILRECREQTGLSVSDVAKKIPGIDSMEREEVKLTFSQLDTLADLYKVPRWVFVSESLPEQHRFSRNLSFREFSDNCEELFSNPEIRSVTAMVERFRDLILDLRENMDGPVESFSPPAIESGTSASAAAARVREWLECREEHLDFREWKRKLEEKNIFIFTTSKHEGWSRVGDGRFRGISIYHSTLPIIVINNSDAKKARTFSLFHELGHLLRKKSEIVYWKDRGRDADDWCDDLAGNVLMPSEEFRAVACRRGASNLKDIEKIAGHFKVSSCTCLVRMKRLGIVSSDTCRNLELQLQDLHEQQEGISRPVRRNRPDEVLDQYGHIYAGALFHAYRDNEIGLHKLCRLFGLKKASDALRLEKKL